MTAHDPVRSSPGAGRVVIGGGLAVRTHDGSTYFFELDLAVRPGKTAHFGGALEDGEVVGPGGESAAPLEGGELGPAQTSVLRYWMELTVAEVAHTMGISVGAAKSHIFRGLGNVSTVMVGSREVRR